MIEWSFVFKAFLTGIINYGKTANIFVAPLSSNSSQPWAAKNLYGSCYSLNPSKNIGKYKW